MVLTTDTQAGRLANLPPVSLTVPYTQIPVLPWEWLLKGWLPFGLPVLVAAPGGTGKGVLIAAMASKVTTGARWPGDPEGMVRERGSVVMVAPEDDANRVTAPRLIASGADLRFVHDLSVFPDGSRFRWPQSKDKLCTAIREINAKAERAAQLGLSEDDPDFMPPVRLVTIDPLYRCVAKRITETNALDLVEALEDVCAEFSVAMVVSHHTTKDKRVVSGSRALTDAFRAVFLLQRDEDERLSRTRHLAVFKANILPDDAKLTYELHGADETTHAVLIDPPPEPETPEVAANRIRRTTAELQAQGKFARSQAAPAAQSPAPAGQAWRVMRRVNRNGEVSGPDMLPLAPWEGESAGKARAAQDAGVPLTWQAAAGLPGGSIASTTWGEGCRVSYAVYPEQRTVPAVVS